MCAMGTRTGSDRYRFAAPIYDLATAGWSGGAIWETRARALDLAAPGVRMLVPGAGTARLAVEAACRGAAVVVAERSPAMASRARRRIARAGVSVDLHELDVRDLAVAYPFDVIVAEHFLNVFPPDEMSAMRDHLIGRLRPGGTLVIADFAPIDAGASGLARAAQRLHHVLPLGGCALLTGNAMHPIYDHGRDLAGRADVTVESALDAPSFGVGPRWFRTWTVRKEGVASE